MLTFVTFFAVTVVLVIADPKPVNIFQTDITPEEAQKYLSNPPFTEPQLSGRTAVLPLIRWNDPRFRSAEAGPTLGHYWKNGKEIENTDDYLEEVYKASQFHGQDGLGAYTYGYKAPESSKVENRVRSGDVTGSYVYKAGSSNDLIKVRYWADSQGFHQEDNLPKLQPQPVQETEAVKLARIAHEKAWKEAADATLHPYAYQQQQQQQQQQQYQPYGQNQGNFGQNQYSQYRDSKSYEQNNAGQYTGQQSYSGQQQYNGQQQQYPGQQQQQYPGQQQQHNGQQQQYPGQQQYNGQQSFPGQQQYGQQSSFGQQQNQNGGNQYPGQQHQGNLQGSASSQYSQQVAPDQNQANLHGSPSNQNNQGQLQASASTQQSQYSQTSGQSYNGQQSASNQQYQSAPPQFNGQQQQQYNGQEQYGQQQNQGDDGQYHAKYQDAEPTGPPRGFFYSFDYPVSIILPKSEVEGGATNPGHPVDHDTVEHQ